MLVGIVLMVLVFVCAIATLLTLRLNKNHISKLIYYQYNYIPEPLVNLVEAKGLKPM
ncbi:ac110 [Artaxa digramma nucleopolyhedrovirus]|uniref:Ac110 n=1 Tax=Artaxa digramma nucleopolyhedrovirus TaxID=3070910 RepID=A0AAE6R6P1_9ABAC|nr:ac110 [Euproctis digramma nucleopolyhedrovirus]QHB21755.1 ac110 [Artaxa digramma nucleopolyhedrovirus]